MADANGAKIEADEPIKSASKGEDSASIKGVETTGPGNVRAKAAKGGIEMEIDVPDLQKVADQAAIQAIQQVAQNVVATTAKTNDDIPTVEDEDNEREVDNTTVPPPPPPLTTPPKNDEEEVDSEATNNEDQIDDEKDKTTENQKENNPQKTPVENEPKKTVGDSPINPNTPVPNNADTNKKVTDPSTKPTPTSDPTQIANQMKEDNSRRKKSGVANRLRNIAVSNIPLAQNPKLQPTKKQNADQSQEEYTMAKMRQAANVMDTLRTQKRKLSKQADDITKQINRLRTGSDRLNRSRGMSILRLFFPGIASRIEGSQEFKQDKNQAKFVQKLRTAILQTKANRAILEGVVLLIAAFIDAILDIAGWIMPTFGLILLISPIIILFQCPLHYLLGGKVSTPIKNLIKDLDLRLEILEEIYKKENKILQLMGKRATVREEMKNSSQSPGMADNQQNPNGNQTPENNQPANDNKENPESEANYAKAA